MAEDPELAARTQRMLERHQLVIDIATYVKSCSDLALDSGPVIDVLAKQIVLKFGGETPAPNPAGHWTDADFGRITKALLIGNATLDEQEEARLMLLAAKELHLEFHRLQDGARQMTERHGEVWEALQESLKLQAHYAELLNMHDGGQRLIFTTVDAWLARLREGRR
jgi:hypothetical protein